MRLWGYYAERKEKMNNVTPHNIFQLNGNTPIFDTHGTQGYISNIFQFVWYDWCYFQEEGKVKLTFQKQQIGHLLGPMKNDVNETTQAVLNINTHVVPRWTIRRLTTE